jgi:hypothetical protein
MGIPIFSKRAVLSITILCGIFISFACSPNPSVAATPVPSNTVATTYTPTPIPTDTPTPAPTATIQPSITPSPTVTPTPLVADLGQVIFSESFDNLGFDFDYWGPARVEAGVVVLEREIGYKPPAGLWPYGGIGTKFPILPDTTTIVLFKVTSGTTFNIGYHNNKYGDESLRRFSYNSGEGKWDWYEGHLTSSGNYPLKQWKARQSNFYTWHYFLIKRSANGDIEAKMWERDKPKTLFEFKGNLGPEWGTLELTFFIDYHKGSFLLDEYQNLK